MSIGYILLLKNKKISKDILINKIESLGYSCNKFEQLPKQIYINLEQEIGFSIFLLDSENCIYNCWDTNFLEDNFVSKQILEFRLFKDYLDFKRRYNVLLKIVFELATELNEDAILLSNDDTELCFFRASKSILLNNDSGIWDRDCFRDVILNRDICYM